MAVSFLIVDDIPAQQRLLANVIMFIGGESQLSSNGRDALHQVKHGSFDVVLMDLNMPVLSGLESADQIIHHWIGVAHRPLLLAVTGDTRYDSRTLCRAIGMDGFIAKPYSVSVLRDNLRELIVRGSAWPDGAPRRVLSLEKVKSALLKYPDFESQALESRLVLSQLHNNLSTLELPSCHEKALELKTFGQRFGFLTLVQTMNALKQITDTKELTSFGSRLTEQKEDFELAYNAVRIWNANHAMASAQMMIA